MAKKSYKDYLHCIYVHYNELDDLIQKFKKLEELDSFSDYLIDKDECVIFFNANMYFSGLNIKEDLYIKNDLYKLRDAIGFWERNPDYKHNIYANYRNKETVEESFYRNECIILDQNKRDILLEKNGEPILVMNLFQWSVGTMNHHQWVNSNYLKLKYENR